MMSILSAGFFGSRLYAISPAIWLEAKPSMLRCLVRSMCILEFVIDCFNERPFPQHDFVMQVHEGVSHVLLEFVHKVYVVNEKPFKKILAYVSPVGKNLSEEPLRKVLVLQWLTVVHVPGRERPLYFSLHGRLSLYAA